MFLLTNTIEQQGNPISETLDFELIKKYQNRQYADALIPIWGVVPYSFKKLMTSVYSNHWGYDLNFFYGVFSIQGFLDPSIVISDKNDTEEIRGLLEFVRNKKVYKLRSPSQSCTFSIMGLRGNNAIFRIL